MSNNPAGWFPDPHGRAEKRWWNGTAWTEFVSVGGQSFVDAPTPSPSAPHAPAGVAPMQQMPTAPPRAAKGGGSSGSKIAIAAVVALVAGGVIGYVARGDGKDSGGGGGGGGNPGGVTETGALTTPILEGLASLDTYEYKLTLTTLGPTEADHSETNLTGASDYAKNLRHSTQTSKTFSADDPNPETNSTETWGNSDMTCTFDGKEYTSKEANPFVGDDLGGVLKGVFDIVIPKGNTKLVGTETIAGVEAKHYTFTVEGLAGGSGAQVEKNEGSLWVAKDGNYVLKYQVNALLRSAAKGTEESEIYGYTVTLEMTTVNKPVSIQIPTKCPAPVPGGES